MKSIIDGWNEVEPSMNQIWANDVGNLYLIKIVVDGDVLVWSYSSGRYVTYRDTYFKKNFTFYGYPINEKHC